MSAVKQAAHNFEAARIKRESLPWRKIGIYFAVALCIFLIGFVPMWFMARETASQRDAAQGELRLSRMENALASAVIDTRRGEYEIARQTASDFFTTLRERVDTAAGTTSLNQSQSESLSKLLNERDQIITLLARSDPAAADRLSDLYVSYRQTMSNIGPPDKN
jgi:hypothetical protein